MAAIIPSGQTRRKLVKPGIFPCSPGTCMVPGARAGVVMWAGCLCSLR